MNLYLRAKQMKIFQSKKLSFHIMLFLTPFECFVYHRCRFPFQIIHFLFLSNQGKYSVSPHIIDTHMSFSPLLANANKGLLFFILPKLRKKSIKFILRR